MSFRSLWIGAFTAAAVFGAVTSANSALIIVTPEDAVIGGADTAVISPGDIAAADVDKANSGSFSDVFFFTNNLGVDSFLNFSINTTFPDGALTGVANLEFAFSNGDTFSGITDGNGVLNPVPFRLTTAFAAVGDLVLTVSGDPFGAIPSYDFQASVVPLPPALLLFGTALGGMGWLSRRRKESATA